MVVRTTCWSDRRQATDRGWQGEWAPWVVCGGLWCSVALVGGLVGGQALDRRRAKASRGKRSDR